MKTKELLDKYIGLVSVLDDNSRNYSFNKENKQIIVSKWRNPEFIYNGNYKENLVLWTCPDNVIAIEFEGDRENNVKAILETYDNAIIKGFECCICDHIGKSPYLWIFNIQNIPCETKEVLLNARKKLAFSIVPKKFQKDLDTSNFTKGNLIPIPNHKHWKTKYRGAIHKIIVGKHPLYQKNVFPKELMRENQNICLNDESILNQLLKGDTKAKELFYSKAVKGFRSEKEFSFVLLLVSHNLNFSQVDYIMNQSVLGDKWRNESTHYRLKTFSNAKNNVHTPRTINTSNGVGFLLGDNKKK